MHDAAKIAPPGYFREKAPVQRAAFLPVQPDSGAAELMAEELEREGLRGVYRVDTECCAEVQDALDQLRRLLELQPESALTRHRAFEAARELAAQAQQCELGAGPLEHFHASVACRSLRGPMTVRFGWTTGPAPRWHEHVRVVS